MTSLDAASLRAVDTADVLLGEKVVATLVRTGRDDIRFEYADPPAAEARIRPISVSWSLPADAAGPVLTAGGSVPPFFAGLLPEGVRLGAVVSSTKTSLDDHLTLLLAVGADTVGDVRVVPTGSVPSAPTPMFSPGQDVDFGTVFDRLVGSVEADPVALAGVQPKVSAAMWSVPTRTKAGPAILKLTPPNGFPRLSENEHFFLRMAGACGLRVPTTSLLYDSNGRSGLLIARFDRANGMRIPQEDACQVAGLYPASKYRMTAETAITALADACARGGGSRTAAVLELLRAFVFSSVIGNGDLHGKNLSIYAPGGLWQPTPVYDVLTTQPYTGWRDPMALSLYGRANRFRRKHFVDAGLQLGLRERALNRMIDDLVTAAQPWPDRCAEIGFPDRETMRLGAMLRDRIDALT